MNAKVSDRFAAEKQCHRHFAETRRGGEWFEAELVDVVEYLHEQLDWLEIDFESPGRVMQYLLATRNGNQMLARATLARGRT